MQKVQDAIYTSMMAARKLGFTESPTVLWLHGFSIRQTSLYNVDDRLRGPSHTAGTLKIARGEIAFVLSVSTQGEKSIKKI